LIKFLIAVLLLLSFNTGSLVIGQEATQILAKVVEHYTQHHSRLECMLEDNAELEVDVSAPSRK
jgi:hypothetical protein